MLEYNQRQKLLKHNTKVTDNKRVDKLILINLNTCASKDNVKRMKRQLTEWVPIFTNCISDKELIFRIYKELLNSTTKKRLNLGTSLVALCHDSQLQMQGA